MGYIYKITNLVNGKSYIGKTERSIKVRWKEHLRLSRLNYQLPLYRAFLKYGTDNFSVEQIEECDPTILDEREIYWIAYYDTYRNGYNCTEGGEGGIKTYQEDIDIIIQRYSQGERLDKLCKEYHHDYNSLKNRLIEHGVVIDSQAGPKKLSKKIYALDPVSKQCVASYNSISEASRALCQPGKNPRAIANHISKQKNTNNICHGFIWTTTLDF